MIKTLLFGLALAHIEEFGAPPTSFERTASHYKTVEMDHKFASALEWQPRSKVLLGYDSRGTIVNVEVNTQAPADDIFTDACERGDSYQLQIAELSLMTSVNPCLYSTHGGLNETFVFSTLDGKELSGFFYEVRDLEYLATREKRAKAKRLMLTADFSEWKTDTRVQGFEEFEAAEKAAQPEPAHRACDTLQGNVPYLH